MASINSLTGSSGYSSIYGTRNVISGLASGLDTEALIENAVSGYSMKITQLQQKMTKVTWEQEAYRSIISKLVNFNNTYASYSSNTNLLSPSFFNNSILTKTTGENADKVSASGKSSSNIQLLGVKSLATAATYTTSSVGKTTATDTPAISGGDVNLEDKMELSKVSGSLTLNYGGSRKISISFDELDVYKNTDEFVAAINEKLGEQSMTLSSGTTVTADERIGVKVNDSGNIEFYDKANAGNTVYVSSASGDIKSTLGITPSTSETTLEVSGKELYSADTTKADYLKTQGLTFTLDGIKKTITFDKTDDISSTDKLASVLQGKLDEAFGDGKFTVGTHTVETVENEDGTTSVAEGLTFTAQKGSTFAISGGETIGLASNSETSYFNTSKTLGDLLGEDAFSDEWRIAAEGALKEMPASGGKAAYFVDSEGNRVADDGTGNYYRVNEDNEFLYDFKLNGESVGQFSKSTTLEKVMTSINNSDAGVTVSFSQITNQFKFTADDTGVAGRIEMGEGLAQALFGDTSTDGTYTEGTDAVFSMTVNGVEYENISRSSNSFTVDGMTINLKGTFGYEDVRVKDEATGFYKAAESYSGFVMNEISPGEYTVETVVTDLLNENGEYVDAQGRLVSASPVYGEVGPTNATGSFVDAKGNAIDPADAEAHVVLNESTEAVTFTTSTDTDKIVDAIKKMVEDYNAMAKEIKDAYSTMPNTDSSGDEYEPLTDEDRADMSESEIKNYEEKAKQGLLFGDYDLSTLYDKLRSAISSVGLDKIGIETTYSDGLTTISINETELRAALETDLEGVKDAFTNSVANGSSSNGLMQSLKGTLDAYAGTVGATKGILISKAGSTYAATSLSDNYLQKQISQIEDQIERWQDKLEDKIDYYTSKFTALETLIAEMNSQSSALMGLTGSGY